MKKSSCASKGKAFELAALRWIKTFLNVLIHLKVKTRICKMLEHRHFKRADSGLEAPKH